MPKNIVLLSDGTGNSSAKLSKTNVWRLYQALDLSQPDKQIAFYDDGVGTSSFQPLAVIGGAFGYGLKRNIRDLYTFVCRNYEPGDQIYCFGFSRGAFTVRSLTGLINCEGLVSDPTDAGLTALAKTAFREYRRKRYPADLPFDKIGRFLRDLFVGDKGYATRAKHAKPEIRFLGLWDTVAAYGLPTDEMTRALNWVWRLYPMNREPLDNVLRTCHAVALDDERNTFHPMLFNEEHEPGGNQYSKNIREERVSQVWFTGMHSDVGGGYPDDALSYVSLNWMVDQAEGLLLKKKELEDIRTGADPLGKLYDSRKGTGGFYRYLPRKMELLTQDKLWKDSKVAIPRPKIHESVFQRIKEGVDRYAPIVLPPHYAVVKNDGNIVDSAQVLEHATQSQARAHLQENIWNLVWWKRVFYFLSILVASLLVAFPLYFHPTEVCEEWACFISPVIGWAGVFLPSFAETWLAAYRSHPSYFAFLLGGFAALLMAGDTVKQKSLDAMRGLWNDAVSNPGKQVPEAPPPSNFLFRFRTHPVYRWFFIQMKRRVLPAAFGLVSLCAIFGTVSRLGFKVISSAGGVCSQQANGDVFPTTSVCWDTGQDVELGKNYNITLTIVDKNDYKDNHIPTGLGGFGREKMRWAHPIAVFYRRHLTESWFKPLARIGERGADEYVLNPADGSKPNDDTPEITAVITARRTGRLFLFVNDAVLPVPNEWQYFYNNNHGKLRVSVKLKPAARE